jgi:hypothetical protein
VRNFALLAIINIREFGLGRINTGVCRISKCFS